MVSIEYILSLPMNNYLPLKVPTYSGFKENVLFLGIFYCVNLHPKRGNFYIIYYSVNYSDSQLL